MICKIQVDRSIALLKSLGIERERWEATSETFKSQMATIIGDVLLSSAYLAYAGYFDQHVSDYVITVLVLKQVFENNESNYLLGMC